MSAILFLIDLLLEKLNIQVQAPVSQAVKQRLNIVEILNNIEQIPKEQKESDSLSCSLPFLL